MENVDLQIKNLENQIAILKERQRVQGICASIEKKAKVRDNAIKSEVDELMDKFIDYKLRIDDLADDLLNIQDIAITLRENGYKVPTHFPSSRIHLEFHHNDEETTTELKIINIVLSVTEGYLLIKTNGNLSNDPEDYSVRNSTFDAINRGVWDRGMTDNEKIRFLKMDIDLMAEYVTNLDLFLTDFYNYAENV